MNWSKCTVTTSRLTLRWMCDSPRQGCAWRITPIYSYMWHEQAIAEWSRQVISTIACCCHSVKLCALAAQGFRWCCAQDVKIMPDAAFTKRMCYRCGSLWKGDVVATSWLTLCWMCDSPWMGCARRIKPIYISYVLWTSNNKMISLGDLNCCLLSQCEALRTCCSGFPITTGLSSLPLDQFCQSGLSNGKITPAMLFPLIAK